MIAGLIKQCSDLWTCMIGIYTAKNKSPSQMYFWSSIISIFSQLSFLHTMNARLTNDTFAISHCFTRQEPYQPYMASTTIVLRDVLWLDALCGRFCNRIQLQFTIVYTGFWSCASNTEPEIHPPNDRMSRSRASCLLGYRKYSVVAIVAMHKSFLVVSA